MTTDALTLAAKLDRVCDLKDPASIFSDTRLSLTERRIILSLAILIYDTEQDMTVKGIKEARAMGRQFIISGVITPIGNSEESAFAETIEFSQYGDELSISIPALYVSLFAEMSAAKCKDLLDRAVVAALGPKAYAYWPREGSTKIAWENMI